MRVGHALCSTRTGGRMPRITSVMRTASTVWGMSCMRRIRAPFMMHTTAAAIEPSMPAALLAADRLAHEVLVRHRRQRRQPDRDDLVEAAGQLEGVQRVLVEVVPGVDHEALERDAAARPRGQRAASRILAHLRHHVAVPAGSAARTAAAARGCGSG